jgi:hypothetical protein
MEIIQTRKPLWFTYEKLCGDPESILALVRERVPLLRTTIHEAMVEVKDYPRQGLRNYNRQQVQRLSSIEKDAIYNVVDRHAGLLKFFGYSASWRDDSNLE